MINWTNFHPVRELVFLAREKKLRNFRLGRTLCFKRRSEHTSLTYLIKSDLILDSICWMVDLPNFKMRIRKVTLLLFPTKLF